MRTKRRVTSLSKPKQIGFLHAHARHTQPRCSDARPANNQGPVTYDVAESCIDAINAISLFHTPDNVGEEADALVL
jgi:hypothetical protein